MKFLPCISDQIHYSKVEKDTFVEFPLPFLSRRFSFLLSLSLILIFGRGLGQAQESIPAKPSPPSPPYVADLSGTFSLVKTIVYKPQPAPVVPASPALVTPPALKELDAIQTGSLRRDVEYYVNNTSMEIWRLGNSRFFTYPGRSDHVLLMFLSQGYKDHPDFSELDWISADSFQGQQDYQDKTCYVYKSGDQTAYIEKATLRPVYFESNLMQVTYTFRPPPDRPLQLPANVQKKLQQAQRAWTGQTN